MSVRRLLRPQWPIVTVMLIFVVAFSLAAANFWRRGALLIGIGVGLAAVLRLALTEDRAGLLVVRSKGIDFATVANIRAACGDMPWRATPDAAAAKLPPGWAIIGQMDWPTAIALPGSPY